MSSQDDILQDLRMSQKAHRSCNLLSRCAVQGTCKERSKKIPVPGYKCSAVYTSLMGVKNKAGGIWLLTESPAGDKFLISSTAQTERLSERSREGLECQTCCC